VSGYRGNIINASLPGWWTRAFESGLVEDGLAKLPLLADPYPPPIVRSPAVAVVGALASCVAVVGIWLWSTRRAATPAGRDRAWALGLGALVLVGPITWDHSLLLLMPAGAWLGREVSARAGARLVAAALMVPLCAHWGVVGEGALGLLLGPAPGRLPAWMLPTVVGFPCLVLVGLFVLMWSIPADEPRGAGE
jgi:hypothetical protein